MKYFKINYRSITVAVFNNEFIAKRFIRDNPEMPYKLETFEGDLYTLKNLGKEEQ